LTADERLTLLLDEGSFQPLPPVRPRNQLKIPGYTEKLVQSHETSGLVEAIVTGQGTIQGLKTMIGVMDSHFMMGTLNTAVGAQIRRLYLEAAHLALPVILVIASGGARMQEGLFSLFQMNTILAAKRVFDQQRQVAISVLTDPTMGGVSASFAFENDIVIAEKQAQIGFAGRRVIQATSQEQLPPHFQQASDLLAHGLIDDQVSREGLQDYLATVLRLHHGGHTDA
jgi:acetyl-CoA carboxylase carboxyl transferase subunit beta